MDIVRTGMFHNAYFHLIHLCEHLKSERFVFKLRIRKRKKIMNIEK